MGETLLLRSSLLNETMEKTQQSISDAGDRIAVLMEDTELLMEHWKGAAGENWQKEWGLCLGEMKQQLAMLQKQGQVLQLAAEELIETEHGILELIESL